ncbi:MAG: hypothetical protein KGY65_07445 [Candidatus Thermoplasmatota archaeon]|nr:hypothetical protein [Candidatus Thermoplasmatota archaeon]
MESQSIYLVSDEHPYYSLLISPLACWYTDNEQSLQPLLIVQEKTVSAKQQDFISTFKSDSTIISVGFTPTNYSVDQTYIGSPRILSYQLAKDYFRKIDKALLVPIDETIDTYTRALLSTPLASYLHMPILLYNSNQKNHQELFSTLKSLQVSSIYVVGSTIPSKLHDSYEIIEMKNAHDIQEVVLSAINHRFNKMDYVTLTNPKDVLPLNLQDENKELMRVPIQHTSLYLFGRKFILSGFDTVTKKITIPSGIHKYSIKLTMEETTSVFPKEGSIPVFLSATLTNPNGRIIAYGHSPGYRNNATFIETLITNHSGEYTLTTSLFHGYRGGYFSLRGLSDVQTNLKIEQHMQTLNDAHYPLISGLSQNAAYLTSAHGGIILADEQFSLTDEKYLEIADHHSTGPWYDETLQKYNNEKVNLIISRLQENLSLLKNHDLYQGYMNGSGWLALLGDTNMIPMYYYPSNQTHLAERGLPSDNPYSLNHCLSPGRIMSYTTSDTSLLIGRTLFYEQLCGPPTPEDEWHRKFNFVFGEGFGETGGFFHQIPYANAIESYGFLTVVYGDLRNSRQAAERLKVYTDANYVEYLGHGDWFWFTPSIYGFNSIGQSIGASHVRAWDINRPNVFLTSACLMGRVDGVPPQMSIALSFLYAGCNAFVGSTRETGQESGLTVLEDHLILDDYSLGEALRGEKRVDTVTPTYYVRCLFGDPAFNPYDPVHGFSDQGMPLS